MKGKEVKKLCVTGESSASKIEDTWVLLLVLAQNTV